MAEFINQLRGFRIDCGGPSLREISRAAQRRQDMLPVSTLSDNLKPTARPRWPFVEAFLRACREAAGGQLMDAELRRWRRAWHLAYAEDTDRPGSVRAAAGSASDSMIPAGPASFSAMCRDYVTTLRQRLSSVDLEVLAPASEHGDHPRMRMESVFVSPSLCPTGPQLELPMALRRALAETAQIPFEDAPVFLDRHHLRAAQRTYDENRPRSGVDILAARRRVVILGNPGAGKSALTRYVLLEIAALLGNPPALSPDTAPVPTTAVRLPIAQYTVVAMTNPSATTASADQSRIAHPAGTGPEAATGIGLPKPRGKSELDQIIEAWPGIRRAVALSAPRTHALMTAGQPCALFGDVLELSHQHAELAVRLAGSSHTGALEATIERSLGRHYTVRWLLPEDAVIDDPVIDDGAVDVQARRWARPPAALADLAGWLPIWVELRALASTAPRHESVLDYLDAQYRSEAFGFAKADLEHYLLTDGRAVVVFDGLDEIFDPQTRLWAIRQIEGFTRRHPRARIIVTSRILGYRQKHLADAGFDHFTVQDFTDDQIDTFARTWAATVFPRDLVAATAMAQRLRRAIDRSPATAELAANPMLLTILASMSRHHDLPRDRASVLRHAVAVLVEQWDTSKLLSDTDIESSYGLSFHDKLQLLQLATRQMHRRRESDPGNHCTAPALVEAFYTYLRRTLHLPADRAVLLARAMLARFRIRNSLLAHLGGEIYGFIHRAFLDYLTAADLHHRWADKKLTDQQIIRLFHDNADDPTWNEVLSLLATMVPAPLAAMLAAHLLNHGDTAYIYRCAPSDHPADYFWEEFTPTAHTRQALNILAHLQGRSGAAALEPHSTALTVGVIRLLREADRAESWRMLDEPSLLTTLPHDATWIDRPLYRGWYEQWWPSAGPLCSSEVFTDDYSTSWRVAAQLYLDHPHNLQALVALTNGGDPMVCSLALQQLISEFAAQPDTIEILRRHAAGHAFAEIRAMAVTAIADSCPHLPDTIELIHRCALDPSPQVRLDAYGALAQHWPHEAATLPRLLTALADDDDEYLRDELAKLLIQHWPEERSVWQAWGERAVGDPSSNVRLTAIEALVNWAPENELPEVIVEHAYNDEDAISEVAEPAYRAMTVRRVLREAGFTVTGTAATVAGIHDHEAWALAQESTPTEILEFGNDAADFNRRFTSACASLIADSFPHEAESSAYLAIPEKCSWQKVTFSGTPDYAQLLRHKNRRHGLARPITEFARIATDGSALICASIDAKNAHLILAIRDTNQNPGRQRQ